MLLPPAVGCRRIPGQAQGLHVEIRQQHPRVWTGGGELLAFSGALVGKSERVLV